MRSTVSGELIKPKSQGSQGGFLCHFRPHAARSRQRRTVAMEQAGAAAAHQFISVVSIRQESITKSSGSWELIRLLGAS